MIKTVNLIIVEIKTSIYQGSYSVCSSTGSSSLSSLSSSLEIIISSIMDMFFSLCFFFPICTLLKKIVGNIFLLSYILNRVLLLPSRDNESLFCNDFNVIRFYFCLQIFLLINRLAIKCLHHNIADRNPNRFVYFQQSLIFDYKAVVISAPT